MTKNTSIKNVLVIDDDPVLVKILDARLHSEGYNVKTAQEAPEGLQIAMNETPDLIILDVMMPIINGYNVCRLLKSEEKQKHIPIILLTSRNEREDVAIGMDMGADAYLTKPVNMDELLRTIDFVSTMTKE